MICSDSTRHVAVLSFDTTPHLENPRCVFDARQLWFTEPVPLLHSVSDVLNWQTHHVRVPFVGPSNRPNTHTWTSSFVDNTWEPKGLLLAPGERREAQEAGEANVDAAASPGPAAFPGLPGWAAAAGWKKSAGRWMRGKAPSPSSSENGVNVWSPWH